ncbi:sensor histidine kinase [Cohnella phaseoli]|uniref:HAMP domain-containing protein n=1 Tax=Cohnella phaseoli TaxID=456490 RepID=A0A3D9JMF3_9BACL|nr:sensor histidine kinase [Cohnella phaseoli]RED75218.1 HAMP domain-containing protein [Cohnella phaseoli]
MSSGRRQYSLSIRLVISNVIMVLLPILLVGGIAASVNDRIMKESVSQTVDVLFSQINGRIEDYFDDMDVYTQTIFYDKSVQTLVQREEMGWTQYYQIKSYLDTYRDMNKSVKGIYFIHFDGSVYTSSSVALEEDPWKLLRPPASDSAEGLFFYASGGELRLPDYYIAAYRFIKSITESHFLEPIGLGLVILDRNRLQSMLTESNLNKKWKFYIVDSGNRVVASTEDRVVGSSLADEFFLTDGDFKSISGISHFVRSSPVNKAEWKLVAAIPENELFWEGRAFKYLISIIVVIMLVFMLAFASYFNLYITNPIRKLTRAIAKAAAGDFKTKVRFTSPNEFTGIADAFNHMVSEIDVLTRGMVSTQKQLYETELEKKQLQLTGLQGQINSHFLYNTLQGIRGMALSHSVEEINHTVDHLVKYLRYGVHDGEYATLREEWNHVDSYMQIQNMRYGNRFRWMLGAEESLLEHPVLKLLLQPIVENAVLHGMNGSRARGVLKITAKVERGNLVVRILNIGSGMDAESVERLNARLQLVASNSIEQGTRQSIGLLNIQKRLKMYYGNEYGIRIKSWERSGTSVSVIIPFAGKGDIR